MTLLLVILVLVLAGALTLAAYVAHPTPAACGDRANAPSKWRTAPPASFIVGTYNVCSGKGTDGVRDILRAASVVKQGDIVALQELRAATHFRTPSQAEQLGSANDMGWLFAPTRTRWFRDYRGNALLTRFPVTDWYREPLPDVSGHSFRNLTSAVLRVGDRDLWVLFTHLHPRLGTQRQLATVIRRFRDHAPAILVGDLNTARDNEQLAALLSEQGVTDALATGLGTQDHSDRIDWIITKGLVISAGGMTEKGTSDHPYYWVEVSFS